MTRRSIAIAYNAVADPHGRAQHDAAEEHLVHDEIPDIELALRQLGYEPLRLPVGDVLDALRTLDERRPAALVNLCDDLPGSSAHEMHFAGALELLGIPYSGAPPLALGLCRDKAKTKRILRSCGVPTPAFVVAEGPDFAVEGLRFPLIAKPATEDGSLGITDASVAHDETALRSGVACLLERYGPTLVEEYIDGRELNVPLFGNDPPQVLPISEIDFSGLPTGHPRICGYEAKWLQDDARYRGTVGVCPAPLEDAARDRMERWSLLAFRALGLRDYARIDWRLSPTRGPMFLEANPNPDISPASGFMRSWRAAGFDYRELVRRLVEAVLGRSRALIVIAALLLACGLGAAGPCGAQDLDAQIQEVRTLLREKRYPLALESLRILARQLQDLRLEEVRAAFPEPPAGWTATPPISLLADDEIWSSRLAGRRTYLRNAGAVKVDLTIDIHSPLAPAIAMSFNPVFLAGDARGRLVQVGGQRGLLRLFPDTGEGDLRILVARDTLLTLTGRGIDGDQALVDLAGRVDFALLRTRSGP